MKKIIILIVTLVVVCLIINKQRAMPTLQFYVFDVGQGSSSLIITSSHENIMIDAGPDAKAVAELGKNLPVYDRTLDVLVITHSHDDHIGGLPEVFRQYDIKNIIYTGVVDKTEIYQKVLALIDQERARLIIAKAGQEFCFDNCTLKMKILYPINLINNKEFKNPNDASIVTEFNQNNNYIFITGDLETAGEKEIVDYWNDKLKIKDSDHVIYVAGHHGSNTSSSKLLLDLIKPDISIISVGLKNKFKHPSLLIVERLKARSKVWRTDAVGTIRAVIKNNHWQVESFKFSLLNLF
jgi:competence protein ComEC